MRESVEKVNYDAITSMKFSLWRGSVQTECLTQEPITMNVAMALIILSRKKKKNQNLLYLITDACSSCRFRRMI